MKRENASRPPGSIDLTSVSASAPVRNHADFIWSVADLLRGDYKRSEYGRVILPPHPIGGAVLIGIVVFVFFPRLVKKLTGREVFSSPYI